MTLIWGFSISRIHLAQKRVIRHMLCHSLHKMMIIIDFCLVTADQLVAVRLLEQYVVFPTIDGHKLPFYAVLLQTSMLSQYTMGIKTNN